MAKAIKFTNDTYLDGSSVKIQDAVGGGTVGNYFKVFQTTASGWDAQIKDLETYIDNNCSYGAYVISCYMNGAHAVAHVEKISAYYAAFVIFSYSCFQWYRKINNVWQYQQNMMSIETFNDSQPYKLIYEGKLGATQQDYSFNYNFKKGKTYELFIEGSHTHGADYTILPNSGWYTFNYDRIGGSTGQHYYEHLMGNYLQFRLDLQFSVHYIFQYLDSGIILVHGDWVNRTNNDEIYTRHIMGSSNNAFNPWTSLYFAGTFPAGTHTRVYER